MHNFFIFIFSISDENRLRFDCVHPNPPTGGEGGIRYGVLMEQDILTQAKDLQMQNKEVIKAASIGVLDVIAGSMDTFYDFIPNTNEGEKSAIRYITDALWTFYDMEKN